MDSIIEFFKNLYNYEALIKMVGFYGVIAIVFAETGLLIGFFLPGDSLLLTAGLLTATNFLGVDVTTLIIALVLAAVIGDNCGYWFGRITGEKIFARKDSKLFKQKYLTSAQEFYDKHGGKAIIYARFVPFARTFAPIVAGVAKMPYSKYLTFSISGGILWIASMTLAGYFFGQIPVVKQNFEKVVVLVIVLSVMPIVIGYFKERKKKKAAKA